MLRLRPTDRVLEVGGGTGASARVVGGRLTSGHLVSVDRSATATSRIATACADLVAAGRLVVVPAPLAELTLPEHSVDVAFAVDVNVFWTTDAGRELAVLRRVLVPGGRLAVCFGADGPRAPRLRERVLDPAAGNVARAGFVDVEVHESPEGAAVLARASPCRRPEGTTGA